MGDFKHGEELVHLTAFSDEFPQNSHHAQGKEAFDADLSAPPCSPDNEYVLPGDDLVDPLEGYKPTDYFSPEVRAIQRLAREDDEISHLIALLDTDLTPSQLDRVQQCAVAARDRMAVRRVRQVSHRKGPVALAEHYCSSGTSKVDAPIKSALGIVDPVYIYQKRNGYSSPVAWSDLVRGDNPLPTGVVFRAGAPDCMFRADFTDVVPLGHHHIDAMRSIYPGGSRHRTISRNLLEKIGTLNDTEALAFLREVFRRDDPQHRKRLRAAIEPLAHLAAEAGVEFELDFAYTAPTPFHTVMSAFRHLNPTEPIAFWLYADRVVRCWYDFFVEYVRTRDMDRKHLRSVYDKEFGRLANHPSVVAALNHLTPAEAHVARACGDLELAIQFARQEYLYDHIGPLAWDVSARKAQDAHYDRRRSNESRRRQKARDEKMADRDPFSEDSSVIEQQGSPPPRFDDLLELLGWRPYHLAELFTVLNYPEIMVDQDNHNIYSATAKFPDWAKQQLRLFWDQKGNPSGDLYDFFVLAYELLSPFAHAPEPLPPRDHPRFRPLYLYQQSEPARPMPGEGAVFDVPNRETRRPPDVAAPSQSSFTRTATEDATSIHVIMQRLFTGTAYRNADYGPVHAPSDPFAPMFNEAEVQFAPGMMYKAHENRIVQTITRHWNADGTPRGNVTEFVAFVRMVQTVFPTGPENSPDVEPPIRPQSFESLLASFSNAKAQYVEAAWRVWNRFKSIAFNLAISEDTRILWQVRLFLLVKIYLAFVVPGRHGIDKVADLGLWVLAWVDLTSVFSTQPSPDMGSMASCLNALFNGFKSGTDHLKMRAADYLTRVQSPETVYENALAHFNEIVETATRYGFQRTIYVQRVFPPSMIGVEYNRADLSVKLSSVLPVNVPDRLSLIEFHALTLLVSAFTATQCCKEYGADLKWCTTCIVGEYAPDDDAETVVPDDFQLHRPADDEDITQDGPFDFAPCDMIGAVLTFVSSLFGKSLDVMQRHDVIAALRNFLLWKQSIGAAVSIAEYFSRCVSAVAAYLFGVDPFSDMNTHILQGMHAFVSVSQDVPDPTDEQQAMVVLEIDKCFDVLLRAATTTREPFGISLSAFTSAYMRFLPKVEHAKRIMEDTTGRIEPVSICLAGPPGTGKTTAVTLLAMPFMQLCAPDMQVGNANIFTIGESEYLEGLGKHTLVVLRDEALSRRCREDIARETKLITGIVSPGHYNCNMAAVEDKGKMSMNSIMAAFWTTNRMELSANEAQLEDVGALARRMHLVLDVYKRSPDSIIDAEFIVRGGEYWAEFHEWLTQHFGVPMRIAVTDQKLFSWEKCKVPDHCFVVTGKQVVMFMAEIRSYFIRNRNITKPKPEKLADEVRRIRDELLRTHESPGFKPIFASRGDKSTECTFAIDPNAEVLPPKREEPQDEPKPKSSGTYNPFSRFWSATSAPFDMERKRWNEAVVACDIEYMHKVLQAAGNVWKVDHDLHDRYLQFVQTRRDVVERCRRDIDHYEQVDDGISADAVAKYLDKLPDIVEPQGHIYTTIKPSDVATAADRLYRFSKRYGNGRIVKPTNIIGRLSDWVAENMPSCKTLFLLSLFAGTAFVVHQVYKRGVKGLIGSLHDRYDNLFGPRTAPQSKDFYPRTQRASGWRRARKRKAQTKQQGGSKKASTDRVAAMAHTEIKLQYFLQDPSTKKTYEAIGSGFAVAPRTILTYGHTACMFTIQSLRLITFADVKNSYKGSSPWVGTPLKVKLYPEIDAALIELPRSCPTLRTANKFFPEFIDAPALAGREVTFVQTDLSEDGFLQITRTEVPIREMSSLRSYPVIDPSGAPCYNMDLHPDTFLSYSIASRSGACGSRVVMEDQGTEWAIGMHIAGNNSNTGYAVVLDRQTIDAMLDDFQPSERIPPIQAELLAAGASDDIDDEDERPVTVQGLPACYSDVEITEPAVPTDLWGWPVVGILDPKHSWSPSTNTALKRSRFFEHFDTDLIRYSRRYRPAAMRATETNVHPLQRYIENMPPYVEAKFVAPEAAKIDLLQRWGHPPADMRRLLTEDECCNGLFDGDVGIPATVTSTSGGSPYPDKAKYFEIVEREEGPIQVLGRPVHTKIVPTQLLRDVCETWERRVKHHRACPIVPYAATLKDELRPDARVTAGKTRIIFAGNAAMNWLARKYFGMWAIAVKKLTSNGLGTVVQDPHEWKHIGRLLTEPYPDGTDPLTFSIDISGQDTCFHDHVADLLLDCINEWYDDGVENAAMREWFFKNAFSGVFVHQRLIVKPPRIMFFSGFLLTTLLDSEGAWICCRDALRRLARETGGRFYEKSIDLDRYVVHFWAIVYGDDVTMRLHRDTPYQDFPAAFKASSGWTVTDADKNENITPQPIDEIVFLSRRFTVDGRAPLDPIERIIAITQYTATKGTRLDYQQMVDVVLMELCHHGKKVYKHFVDIWSTHEAFTSGWLTLESFYVVDSRRRMAQIIPQGAAPLQASVMAEQHIRFATKLNLDSTADIPFMPGEISGGKHSRTLIDASNDLSQIVTHRHRTLVPQPNTRPFLHPDVAGIAVTSGSSPINHATPPDVLFTKFQPLTVWLADPDVAAVHGRYRGFRYDTMTIQIQLRKLPQHLVGLHNVCIPPDDSGTPLDVEMVGIVGTTQLNSYLVRGDQTIVLNWAQRHVYIAAGQTDWWLAISSLCQANYCAPTDPVDSQFTYTISVQGARWYDPFYGLDAITQQSTKPELISDGLTAPIYEGITPDVCTNFRDLLKVRQRVARMGCTFAQNASFLGAPSLKVTTDVLIITPSATQNDASIRVKQIGSAATAHDFQFDATPIAFGYLARNFRFYRGGFNITIVPLGQSMWVNTRINAYSVDAFTAASQPYFSASFIALRGRFEVTKDPNKEPCTFHLPYSSPYPWQPTFEAFNRMITDDPHARALVLEFTTITTDVDDLELAFDLYVQPSDDFDFRCPAPYQVWNLTNFLPLEVDQRDKERKERSRDIVQQSGRDNGIIERLFGSNTEAVAKEADQTKPGPVTIPATTMTNETAQLTTALADIARELGPLVAQLSKPTIVAAPQPVFDTISAGFHCDGVDNSTSVTPHLTPKMGKGWGMEPEGDHLEMDYIFGKPIRHSTLTLSTTYQSITVAPWVRSGTIDNANYTGSHWYPLLSLFRGWRGDARLTFTLMVCGYDSVELEFVYHPPSVTGSVSLATGNIRWRRFVRINLSDPMQFEYVIPFGDGKPYAATMSTPGGIGTLQVRLRSAALSTDPLNPPPIQLIIDHSYFNVKLYHFDPLYVTTTSFAPGSYTLPDPREQQRRERRRPHRRQLLEEDWDDVASNYSK